MLRVSIPNGPHKPFRPCWLLSMRRVTPRFNPERAPQAIPTVRRFDYEVRLLQVSIPNGPHKPFRRGVRRRAGRLRNSFNPERAPQAIPTLLGIAHGCIAEGV